MASKTLLAALAISTMLAGGNAFAADQASTDQQSTTPPAGHAAVVKDFSKLSVDGVRAFQELTLARLAIFDGRTKEAKKYVDQADKGFNKAKSDESVFTQAEATMRTDTKSGAKSGSNGAGTDASKAASSTSPNSNADGDVNKPVAWLPVDGTVIINEDFTAHPEKAKAVADANKSLEKGDKKGAMEKLKLAEVDTAISLAVVPLQQTITDVDQAKQLIEAGKFYEGSQKLKTVQDSIVITVADMAGMPPKAKTDSSSTAPQGAPADKH